MSLEEEIQKIRAAKSDPRGEEQTKVSVVLPILNQLGWDQRNFSQVRLEEQVGGKKNEKVDIALCSPRGKFLALVEVKAPTVKLEDHIGQLLHYAFYEDAEICVLTTGLVWWLYLPFERGSTADKRCFAELDVKNDSLDQLIEDFETYLAPDNLSSGKAEKRAKQVLEARLHSESLKEQLPQIWGALLKIHRKK